MTKTTKTRAGWAIEITPRRDGALVAGSIAGRRVLYTRAQLALAGIGYDIHPDATVTVAGHTAAEYMLGRYEPARVLRRGVLVE